MTKTFLDEFFRLMKVAEPSTYHAFMLRLEEEFKQAGYRADILIGVENILIVRLDAIGDMILTSGFIREVRKNFPHARITLVVTPLVYPLVELCPYVNEVLTFDLKTLNRNFPIMIETLTAFCRDNLWQQHFSIAFSPQWGSDNLPGLLMAWLSGAHERIGYGTYPYTSWLGATSQQVVAQDNFLLTL